MKNITLISLGLIVFFTTLWSCDKEQDNNSQAAMVFVKHYYTGRTGPNWERVYMQNIYVYGDITGNPLPKINYLQINDIKLSDSQCFSYLQGNISFRSDNNIWIDSISEPKFSPLTIKINTSYGEIEGSITVPDSIKSLTVDAADTIPLNTPITISWTGSDADYFIVDYYHQWMEYFSEENFGMFGYSKDTIVRGNSVTLEGSRFYNNGDISEIEVTPINGPFPEVGVKANMEGDGYGYLYLENRARSTDKTIAIGKGIDYSLFEGYGFKSTVVKKNTTTVSEKIKKAFIMLDNK
jgi:hypothetical protein